MAPMTTVDETIYPYPNAVARFPRLRQSMLAQFDRCPLSAKFGLDYERGWSTHDQARGQLAHRTWAKCLEEMARNGESKIEVDVALAILYEVLRQHDVDARDVVALPAEQIADLRMSVIKWAYDSEFRIEDLVDVEQRLQATITYPSEYGPVERTLTGQLDALFAEGPTRAVVLDWKDTWGMPPESGISFQGYFQQRHYGFLVMENYRAVQTVVLREHYPRYGEYREATVDRDSLEDIRAELSALAERFDRCMEQDIFRPAPGKHCGSARTRFLTDEGVRTLGDACGESVRVLNRHGEWEPASVASFGRQPLLRVTFDGGEVEEMTPDHRWWQEDGTRVTTVELERAPLVRTAELPELDPVGVRHGIVFGDGHVYGRRHYSAVRLQPHKAELAEWFAAGPVAVEHYPGQVVEHEPVKRRADGVVDVLLQPVGYKALPERCSPSYARGFIAGLLATDGSVDSNGGVSIACEGKARAERIAEIARLGGCVVSSVRLVSAVVPASISGIALKRAGEARECMAVRLKPLTAPVVRSDQAARLKATNQMRRMYRRVVSIEEIGVEEVYCVIAPESESFTLASGIVTSNCSYCPRPSACPIFPEVRGEGAIQDAEHARRVAAQLVVARTASERWTRALKAYANIHGPIPVADAKGRRQFGYVRSQSTQRPSREDLERALQAAGGRPIRVDDLYRERVHTRFEEHTPETGVEITPEDARLAEALRSALGDT
jgi:hypothetical protein